MSANGNWSPIRVVRGALREYTSAENPLVLYFDFNPATITRTRSVSIRTGGAPGTIGGYDFGNADEAPRVSQGVTTQPESLSVKILLDATDRMNADDETAREFGIQPEIDILRSMLEPKTQTREGARTLAALGEGGERAFSRQQYASVLIFEWGESTVPVFMTQAQVAIQEYLPNLFPYRAEATMTLQIIESANEFYTGELRRQDSSANGRSRSFESG